MIFSDIIYGQIEVPDWLVPFIKSPEFLRLRGVRLSNVDSFQFKDFNAPTRWEHGIAVSYLALKYSEYKNLNQTDKVHLCLAALLHDIATPPFAHTLEYVLENFNHELESSKLLSTSDNNISGKYPVFESQFPQFEKICKSVNQIFHLSIDPDEISKIILGEGDLGYVINGTIDLDNIDNVTRASLFMGIDIDKKVPLKLVKWLSDKKERPVDAYNDKDPSVKSWMNYRNGMYNMFYNSSSEELGRQAFLQHILRRSHNEGLSQWTMIYNTEESLLNQISTIEDIKGNNKNKRYTLKELVQNYRLLESAFKIIEIKIESKVDLEQLKNPLFADWLEESLTTRHFEPFVIINSRRFNFENAELFAQNAGSILIFKLHTTHIKIEQLPKEYQDTIQNDKNINIQKHLRTAISDMVKTGLQEKPWLKLTKDRIVNIKNNLDAVGNWSFKLSRNETIHTYPATFVHAIPSSLISALGLQGQLIMDPFGGAGQTAIEGIKQGCNVITSDSNSIASLITSVKLTFINSQNRKLISEIKIEDLKKQSINPISKFDNSEKWHNKKTFDELCRIRNYIFSFENSNIVIHQFLKLCFSDILTSTTARKGKDFAYFADNTPLPKGQSTPDYINAYDLFLSKINRNLGILNKLYSSLERKGKSVESELNNASVFQLNITNASCNDFNIEKNSVAGIITSPPYLCMIDYTYGNRLSYYWLFPDKLDAEFNIEIGSRRRRTSKDIQKQYFDDMRKFAISSRDLIKKDGFLCTILGAPTAAQFKDSDVFNEIDKIFEEAGLKRFWSIKRQIHWQRNPGLGKLKFERITVYINS